MPNPFQVVTSTPAWQGEPVELLGSQIRAEDGSGGEVEEAELCYAKGILFVLDVETVSGISPTLDVAIYAKFDGWYMRLLQLTQKTATYCGGRFIRRDGASFTDAITLLDAVPTPTASSGYVKDGVPWGSTFVVAYKISGTFAIEDPGPPFIPAEGFTFSVKAIPLHF
jgi:hypothetical protein